ncbi:hypothetical protein L5515_001453 [Caenorhabditis briggsae]|uniref:Uncharacterized protein n=1 Tax=Caenorhabditis briggsae TaxID=6238 RepID=A0AAE9E1H2_CAEBR|nr:hypothetical protein L5515_001453 [Caenorhabditis briggsae]
MDVELLQSACAVTVAVCSCVSLTLIGCHTADRANARKKNGNSSRRGKKGKKEKSQRSKRGKKDGSKRDKKKPIGQSASAPPGGAPPTKPPGSKDPAGGSQRDKKISAEQSQKPADKDKDKSSRGGSKREKKKKEGSKREKKKETEKKESEQKPPVTPSPNQSPGKVEDDDMHTARDMHSPKTTPSTPTTPETKPTDAQEKEAIASKYVDDAEGAAPVSLGPKKSNTMLEGDEKKAENSMYK